MPTAQTRARLSSWLGRAAAVVPTLALIGLLALSALRLARSVGDTAGIAALAFAGWVGLVLSDLVSGLVHWACDRFGDERTPLIGPLVIAPFREHHVDPQILARKNFFDAASSNAWLALGVLLLWVGLVPVPSGTGAIFLEGCVIWLCGAVFLTNTFHQWAHQQHPPRAARWLQALRIAIKPERHALHHASGDGAYCVTTGWCNPLLDRWRVFERLEHATARLRFEPRRSQRHG